MTKVIAACLMLAAQTYSVPPAVLVGIYQVEGGKPGQAVENTNGTYLKTKRQSKRLFKLRANLPFGGKNP